MWFFSLVGVSYFKTETIHYIAAAKENDLYAMLLLLLDKTNQNNNKEKETEVPIWTGLLLLSSEVCSRRNDMFVWARERERANGARHYSHTKEKIEIFQQQQQ